MNNEYDYSGLYQHNNGNEPPQNSYPNVGSSGANTANTARTDYSQPGDGGYLAPIGVDLVCIPAFANILIDGEERTAIKLICEER